ncbi:MAG: ankyrin repeat domain-containing protein, partial [Gammaproteobacteria bacterium]
MGEQVSGCLRMPFRQRQQELAAVFGVTREQLERWVHEGRISSDQEISEFYPTYESTLERFRRNIADKIIERNQHALRNPHIRLQLNGIDLPSALREITEFLYPFVIVDFQYPDINTPDNNGVTLAYIAAQEGLNDTLRLLVKGLGAEINAPINNGGTPVYIAAQEGRNDTLRVLVKELGAEVNTPTDDDGVTPVCIAAAQG